MSNVLATEPGPLKNRFYFIDIARSIAILLMLEGHFVDDALAQNLRDESNPIYHYWLLIRGFTSPTFLTVTGIVFTYLLLGNEHSTFWENLRVRKGIKRAVELIFWGYLLQFRSFHVLQCIGIGILTIILIYGVSRWIKFIPLWIYYALAGIGLFSSYLYFGLIPVDSYWPQHAPTFIQNIFHGQSSEFPITPNMGYTMFGAMIGVILFQFKEKVKTPLFMLIMFFVGLILFLFSKKLLIDIQQLPFIQVRFIYRMDWLFEKLGMVFMVLSFLLTLETYVLHIKKPNLFLRIGQNTLSIFIIHVVILYGSLTGFGLTHIFHHSLNGYEIFPITLLFILIFVFLVQYIDRLRSLFSFILIPLKKLSNRLFLID
jgi:uncharacterized membrane protein